MAKDFVLKWEGAKLLDKVLNASEDAVFEVAEDAAKQMTADAPRDTGELADNIYAEPVIKKRDEISARVGADAAVYYAAAVEANHPPRPDSCAKLAIERSPSWLM